MASMNGKARRRVKKPQEPTCLELLDAHERKLCGLLLTAIEVKREMYAEPLKAMSDLTNIIDILAKSLGLETCDGETDEAFTGRMVKFCEGKIKEGGKA